MPNINVLSKTVIDKIAAGEVIERPASVVKELIENALDASSDSITIELKDAGRTLIKVIDNGQGMDNQDARNCILRHATSKITSADDLFNIQSLGFRGEACASIAAVSNLLISTKTKDMPSGIQIEIEGGTIKQDKTIGKNTGTTMEVHDLFYNVPARKKFLRADSTELSHCIDIVTRYSLLRQDVSFALIHNGRELLQSPKTDKLLNKLVAIYGKDIAKEMIEVDFEDSFAYVTGYILKPYLAKKDSMQTFFVNGRYVKDKVIQKAIKDAYGTLLFLGRIPAAVLSITVQPNSIDVNVHPAKEVIKFEKEDQLYTVVFDAIKQTIEKNNLIPKVSVDDTAIQSSSGKSYPLDQDSQQVLTAKQSSPKITQTSKKDTRLPIIPFKILGQINKLYVICEDTRGLLIVDQHAAEERVNYERFLDQVRTKKVEKQQLLEPIIITLEPSEITFIEHSLELFSSMGFEIELFGKRQYQIRKVPKVFSHMTQDLFFSMLDAMSSEPIEKIQHEKAAMMACKASVKAGDSLTTPVITQIIERLSQCKNPYTCPHGRPTIISIPIGELEKKFKRTA
tara:strand:- start:1216 stop:2919 length:1704 start_codon:yes stop_codon:yes gene_type:complete